MLSVLTTIKTKQKCRVKNPFKKPHRTLQSTVKLNVLNNTTKYKEKKKTLRMSGIPEQKADFDRRIYITDM